VAFFLFHQADEHLTRCRVMRCFQGPTVKVQSTLFVGDGDLQRVARQNGVQVSAMAAAARRGLRAIGAHTEDAHGVLLRGEVVILLDFADQRLKLRTEEFNGTIASGADDVVMLEAIWLVP